MEFKKISENELQNKLIEFQDFIKLKGNMPENINKNLLLRYLKFFNGNVEKALKRFVGNMEVRSAYANIFFDRDPMKPLFRKINDQVAMTLMPKVTAENNRIVITKLIDVNANDITFDDVTLVSSMIFDTTLIMPENDDGTLADGEILIYDLDGLSAKHLTKISFSSLRGFFRYMSEAHPVRVKQIHLVNCSSMVDKLVMLVRPFIGAKAMQIMHFHTPNSTTLFDFVPKHLLPIELNGTSGNLNEPKCYWVKRTEEHRDFILDNDQWKFVENSDDDNNKDLPIEESFAYMGFC